MCDVFVVYVGDGMNVPRRFVHDYKNVLWYTDIQHFVRRYLTDAEIENMKHEGVVKYYCNLKGYNNAIIFEDENDYNWTQVYFDVENPNDVVKTVNEYVETIAKAWCLAMRHRKTEHADYFDDCYKLNTYMIDVESCLRDAKAFLERMTKR